MSDPKPDALARLEALHAAATNAVWINGCGNGITGPTTPSVGGPTCGERVAMEKWDRDRSKPFPEIAHNVVSYCGETLAIVPGERSVRDANAASIVALHNAFPAMAAVVRAATTTPTMQETLLHLGELSAQEKRAIRAYQLWRESVTNAALAEFEKEVGRG